MELLEKRKSKLKYIFETHFHADFVSGHFDLASVTKAKIVFGPTAEKLTDLYVAKDNEELKVGSITIRVLHTPGHTMESSCFLLIDEKGKEKAVFSGDTVFLNEVGRPDLAVSKDVTREDLAGFLYESIQTKIMKL